METRQMRRSTKIIKKQRLDQHGVDFVSHILEDLKPTERFVYCAVKILETTLAQKEWKTMTINYK